VRYFRHFSHHLDFPESLQLDVFAAMLVAMIVLPERCQRLRAFTMVAL
jgi:hypothetical protein